MGRLHPVWERHAWPSMGHGASPRLPVLYSCHGDQIWLLCRNLVLLAAAGAQIVFFSPLYDSTLPLGATCVYLCGGAVDAEHWEQLSSNRQLLAFIRAFCSTGGHAWAEGAGLLYLARSVEAHDGCSHRVYDTGEMARLRDAAECLYCVL